MWDRSDYICKEEIAESYWSKWRNKNVEDGPKKFSTGFLLEAVDEWLSAQNQEYYYKKYANPVGVIRYFG